MRKGEESTADVQTNDTFQNVMNDTAAYFLATEEQNQDQITANDMRNTRLLEFVAQEEILTSRGYHPNNKRSPYNNNKNNTNNNSEQHNHESRRIYVGNLSWNVTWRDLKEYCLWKGLAVPARVDILTTSEGRSKGCAIVEFHSSQDAQQAMSVLKDTNFMGRQLFVRNDREENKNSRRVYVGNLSWDVAWQDLKDHMRIGDEKVLYAHVLMDKEGRSKGCGIVEYSSSEKAQEAIALFHDTELKGRTIFVREDREASSQQHPPTQTTTTKTTTSCVFVSNLPWQVGWQELKDYMRQTGSVEQAIVLSDENGHSKGCAFVYYQKPQDAARAIRELNSSTMYGRPIYVCEHTNKQNHQQNFVNRS
mmetsp:Transcript_28761/g.41181  ORF Transcript_28761/g.41181 Transcript_28761/m.41181 type:complete len:364 (-) Transcript_28761:97-1188(-)|eukprot:CAMPEP_0172426870 /NCGR_PEP_ID=MMETSP1064-20121228/39435_1 /TAXON_ID=202472 /ORGANISM="Aulacoseira subarctica , Strain CCAP 1002/5" /LENGTH=363 /DNA_ID=CAMNT_0013170721 /DNA_START=56 /DNA_END=1147 /DNA_ORIENTATION=-